MQPAIHQETRTFTASMSGFLLQCIVGCIFYSVGLIIPRKSVCKLICLTRYKHPLKLCILLSLSHSRHLCLLVWRLKKEQ
jgi:hypothetical protein